MIWWSVSGIFFLLLQAHFKGAALGLTVPEMITEIQQEDKDSQWPREMQFPDDSYNPRTGYIYGSGLYLPVKDTDVVFRLYSRGNETEGNVAAIGDSLQSFGFNPLLNTYIITHGFTQSAQVEWLVKIKNSYLENVDCNVITVDWSPIASNVLYFVVRLQTVSVGHLVAKLISGLVRSAGADYSRFHLIGHSLGAHVMGFAGKKLFEETGKKPGRITGLDPAGPLFSGAPKEDRLDKGDADFVDAIHTCSGWLGMVEAIGHADFYPNGGHLPQPECGTDVDTFGTCSHLSACRFYEESIRSKNFLCESCSSYMTYLLRQCMGEKNATMGDPASKNLQGLFFLKTNKDAPYARG